MFNNNVTFYVTGCGYEPQCIHSKKQTHYHCLQCGFAVLGLSQMTSHKYKHQEANLGPSTSGTNWNSIIQKKCQTWKWNKLKIMNLYCEKYISIFWAYSKRLSVVKKRVEKIAFKTVICINVRMAKTNAFYCQSV